MGIFGKTRRRKKKKKKRNNNLISCEVFYNNLPTQAQHANSMSLQMFRLPNSVCHVVSKTYHRRVKSKKKLNE